MNASGAIGLGILALLAGAAHAQSHLFNNHDFAPTAAPGSGFSPAALSVSGEPAPAGGFWRESPNDGGIPPIGKANGATGFNFRPDQFRLADDFTVPAGVEWDVTNLDFYAYQSGAGTTTSTFTSVVVRIWDAKPGTPGAAVVFGDTTTNRLSSAAFTGIYAIFASMHACSIFPEPNRPIFRLRATIPTLTLEPGDYWVEFGVTGSLFSGPWCPTQVYGPTTRSRPWENAISFAVSTGQWSNVVDPGIPTDAGVCAAANSPVGQSFPFEVLGTSRLAGCVPDLTTAAVVGSPGYGVPNGIVNNDDFFFFLTAFAAGNLAVADLTTAAVPGSPGYGVPNGVLNNDDFFYYLTMFAAGC